ncbi:MAG TPA: SRPBCC family protein [Pirellulales bacterium]
MATAPPASKRFRVVGTILIGLVIVIGGLSAFIAARPAKFLIERSAQVEAPPEAVFPLIDNLHEWAKWSPYEKLDPEMKKTFEGPDSGVGASYAWSGNSQAGEGRSTIVETKPNELVALKLEFVKPFEATCHVTFTLVPTANGTNVTWSMEGTNSFVAKAMSLVMDMDKMIGKDFKEGLANLNKVVQDHAKTAGAP